MKRLLTIGFLAFVGALGWQLGEKLSADALSMSIGIFFGVLASVPAALLVLAASRRSGGPSGAEMGRRGQQGYQGQGFQSPVIVVAPPMHGYPPPQQATGGQQGANLLPPPYQVIDQPTQKRQYKLVGEEEEWLDEF